MRKLPIILSHLTWPRGLLALALGAVCLAGLAISLRAQTGEPLPSAWPDQERAVQTHLTADWITYTSPLGYSIRHPAGWFAAPDPAAQRADVLFRDPNFLKIRTGELPVDHSPDHSLEFVVIQQLTFGNLNISPTTSTTRLLQALDRDPYSLHEVVPELSSVSIEAQGSTGLVRAVEVHGHLQLEAYFIHEGQVYIVFALLEDDYDREHLELFQAIVSTLRFER